MLCSCFFCCDVSTFVARDANMATDPGEKCRAHIKEEGEEAVEIVIGCLKLCATGAITEGRSNLCDS